MPPALTALATDEHNQRTTANAFCDAHADRGTRIAFDAECDYRTLSRPGRSMHSRKPPHAARSALQRYSADAALWDMLPARIQSIRFAHQSVERQFHSRR